MAAPGKNQERYQFRAWDAQGVELVNHNFSRLTNEDVQASHACSFRVPMPASDTHHLEIRSGDVVLVSHQLAQAARQPEPSLEVLPQADQTAYRWNNADHPALVIRNSGGDFVAVNRTGAFSLTDTISGGQAQITAALAGCGNIGASTPVMADTSRRIQLAR